MSKKSPLVALLAAALPVTLLPATLLPTALVAAEAPAGNADDAGKLWAGEVTLNYSQSSGNTQASSFAGKSKAVRDGQSWRNTFKIEGDNETGEDDDGEQVRTAEKYFGSARADYKVTTESFLFGLLEHTDDRFSGYDHETAVSFGYGRQLVKNAQHDLKADIGPGYRYSKLEDSDDVEEEGMVRVGAQYIWTINENASFDEDFSSEIGEDKTISKSLSRLKVRINGSLWGSISYEIKHTDEVPPGIKNSDRKTLLGLNYTF